jgi:hypothetical protein
MPVPEPTNALGLWEKVKGYSGWPQTNEDTVRILAGDLHKAGHAFVEKSRFAIEELASTWPDRPGNTLHDRVRYRLSTSAETGSELHTLGGRADNFAREVEGVKRDISTLIDQNLEPYSTIGLLPLIGPAVQEAFAVKLAAQVNTYMQEGAARITGAGGVPLGKPSAPPPGGSPADVNTWWNALLESERQAIRDNSPDLIRNLDGIPAQERHNANVKVLDREIDALKAREAELLRERQEQRGPRYPVSNPELAEVQDRLRGLEAIKQRIAELPPGTPGADRPKAFLLGFDTAGTGKAIVSIGNPDTAANVATLVPGMLTDLGSTGEEIRRVDELYGHTAKAGSPSTAVVSWIGYDAPRDILGSTSESYALEGKGTLDRFQDGLRATHEGPPSRNTVIGHSYGSTTVGHAARDGLAVDKVVLLASPGTGADSVSDFRLDGVDPSEYGTRVYASVAPDDFIHMANTEISAGFPNLSGIAPQQPILVDPLHGPDPTDPEFGATVFNAPAGYGDPHNEAYFAQDSPVLDNLGRIIAGTE